jgi:hypothetical protein
MSEARSVEDKKDELNFHHLPEEPPEIDEDEGVRPRQSLGSILREVFSKGRPHTPVTKRDLGQDRSRALMLLIGGVVGSVLLFLGIFSTPPAKLSRVERDRAQPNLGRPDSTPAAKLASVTPLLSAELHSDDSGRGGLSAADIQNTSQRASVGYDPEEEDAPFTGIFEDQRRTSAAYDPLIAYRRNDVKDARSYAYGVPAVNTGLPATPVTTLQPQVAVTGVMSKSSIVFVRTTGATGQPGTSSVVSSVFDKQTLLAPGSRLIARLESAVTSALKAPVVAAIEYNYERDGVIVVPAGTKAIGELQQASINGYVGITFHTLQMPDGRNEQIEAMAMDLRNEPLKGKVTGTNKGRKFLTRTLSGVGTIAAYVVGAGGSGLGQAITGETLLRDRLASNIASAGEQELTNAAYSQNIVVTVPAQTRLYIVFRKAAVESIERNVVSNPIRGTGPEIPTAQELRELMDLRREINRMYEASAAPPNSTEARGPK